MMREGHLGAEFTLHSTAAGIVSTERAASIDAKQARVTEYAQEHYERYRKRWIGRCYRALLKREGYAPVLTPTGSYHRRKAHLMRAAENIVFFRQANRLKRIARAADRMRGIGRDDGRGR